MRREKVFKPLTLRLSSIEDAGIRHRLEVSFDRFTAERIKANDAMRRAAVADAEAAIAVQQARMSFMQLLLEAGEYLPPVKAEQTWTVYRKDGDQLYECPFTEVDQRNAMRAQRANIDQAARATGAAESLYSGEEENDSKPIGFAGGGAGAED